MQPPPVRPLWEAPGPTTLVVALEARAAHAKASVRKAVFSRRQLKQTYIHAYTLVRE